MSIASSRASPKTITSMRVDLVLLVPQIDLRDAGLLGEDLHLVGRERRELEDLAVVHLSRAGSSGPA